MKASGDSQIPMDDYIGCLVHPFLGSINLDGLMSFCAGIPASCSLLGHVVMRRGWVIGAGSSLDQL
jgi:hypothetical protein